MTSNQPFFWPWNWRNSPLSIGAGRSPQTWHNLKRHFFCWGKTFLHPFWSCVPISIVLMALRRVHACLHAKRERQREPSMAACLVRLYQFQSTPSLDKSRRLIRSPKRPCMHESDGIVRLRVVHQCTMADPSKLSALLSFFPSQCRCFYSIPDICVCSTTADRVQQIFTIFTQTISITLLVLHIFV